MKLVKVLNIQPFDFTGAIQSRSLRVALEVKKEGIQTVFINPSTYNEGRSFSVEAVNAGFKVYIIDALRPVFLNDLNSLLKMVKWLTSFPKALVQFYKMFKKERPQVIQINGLVCVQEALAACLIARKKVIWVLISDLYPRFVIFLLVPLIRFVAKIVFVSKKSKRYYLGVNEDPVIYEPVELNVFNPDNINMYEKQRMKQKFSLKDKYPILVCVANVSPVKGLEYLIKSLVDIKNKFPNVLLVIIGEVFSNPKYYLNLRSLIRSLNLEQQVTFTGYVEHNELPTFLSLADLFVMSSIHEGTPVSILEAMAMKVPVVATNVGGISEQILHNKTGLLISPKDPDEISKAVVNLLDNKKRIHMGEEARKRVEESFSVENCVVKYRNLYKDIVNSTSR